MLAARTTSKQSVAIKRRKSVSLSQKDYIVINGLSFGHRSEEIKAVIRNNFADNRTPLTFRFFNDEGVWKVALTFATTYDINFDGSKGAIGIDFNMEHIAATVIDSHGNFVTCRRFNMNVHGLRSNQVSDLIGCVAKAITTWAYELGLPIVAEDLDFTKMKFNMSDKMSAKRKRQISSLHYSKWGQALASRCLRDNVALKLVDPSYTSLIGRSKFAHNMGISTHHSAAMAIARRGVMTTPERVPQSVGGYVTDQGLHVSFASAVCTDVNHLRGSDWYGLTQVLKLACDTHLSDIRNNSLYVTDYRGKSDVDIACKLVPDDYMESQSLAFRSLDVEIISDLY